MAKKDRKYWPSWRYGPPTKDEKGNFVDHPGQIFQSEKDVPKGWQDTPRKFDKKAEEPKAPKPPEGGHDVPPHVTRDQIKAQLDARGIVYTDNLSNKTLFNRLLDSFTDEEKKAALG